MSFSLAAYPRHYHQESFDCFLGVSSVERKSFLLAQFFVTNRPTSVLSTNQMENLNYSWFMWLIILSVHLLPGQLQLKGTGNLVSQSIFEPNIWSQHIEGREKSVAGCWDWLVLVLILIGCTKRGANILTNHKAQLCKTKVSTSLRKEHKQRWYTLYSNAFLYVWIQCLSPLFVLFS